jgi:hypothetical protein
VDNQTRNGILQQAEELIAELEDKIETMAFHTKKKIAEYTAILVIAKAQGSDHARIGISVEEAEDDLQNARAMKHAIDGANTRLDELVKSISNNPEVLVKILTSWSLLKRLHIAAITESLDLAILRVKLLQHIQW